MPLVIYNNKYLKYNNIYLSNDNLDSEVIAWKRRIINNNGDIDYYLIKLVNTFVKNIKSAGLRSRFLRLNLFLGSNLNAALTPLFLNDDESDTYLGNIFDYNHNLISTDYIPTGITGGIQFNGSTKYISTGFIPSLISKLTIQNAGLLDIFRTSGSQNSVNLGAIQTPVSNGYYYGQVYSSAYYCNLFFSTDTYNWSGYESFKGIAITYKTDKVYLVSNGSLNSTSLSFTSTSNKSNVECYVGAGNYNGTPLPVNRKYNGYGFLNGIQNSTEAINISNFLNTLYTSIGRNDY